MELLRDSVVCKFASLQVCKILGQNLTNWPVCEFVSLQVCKFVRSWGRTLQTGQFASL
jgi:hypothetical protein